MDFGNLLQPIEEFAVAELKKAGPVIVAGLQKLEHAGLADLQGLFHKGLPIALNAVAAQAEKVISGQEKFSDAVTATWQELETGQLGQIVQKDVEALVQLAYRIGGKAAKTL